MKELPLQLYSEGGKLLKEFDGWSEELNHVRSGYLYNPNLVNQSPWGVPLGREDPKEKSLWVACNVLNLPPVIQMINLLMPKE